MFHINICINTNCTGEPSLIKYLQLVYNSKERDGRGGVGEHTGEPWATENPNVNISFPFRLRLESHHRLNRCTINGAGWARRGGRGSRAYE